MFLGPAHMGKSYLGCRDRSNNLFCSHGEMLSHLLGEVSHCDVDSVKCKQKVFPLSRKVCSYVRKNYHGP